MDNLLKNNLFLQYLSGAGGAMSAGEPIGPTLNQITQQNIGAQSKHKLQQSYMKTLQQMLGGLPMGGKISGDKDNLTIKMPTGSLAQEGSQLEGGSGIDWSDPKEQGQLSAFLREGAANPSASPSDVSSADLAGLTAADVSQALSGATNVQALKQKKFTDIVDALYKSRTAADMEKRTEIYGRPAIPKDERINAIKGYEYAKTEEGGSYKGSFKEWERDDRTGNIKDYERYASDEEAMGRTPDDFNTWLRDLRKVEQSELRRPLVTWTTATRELTKRFGKLDPTGMWAITPELQKAHDKAQEFLVENKQANMEPLEAINEANKRARVWIVDREKRFHEYIDAAQEITNKDERRERIKQVQDAYLENYGYVPSARR